MSAKAAFELDSADARVQHQEVNYRNLGLHDVCEGLDTLVISHVDPHYYDSAFGVVALSSNFGKQSSSSHFLFADISNRNDDAGNVEAQQLASSLQAHS